ncbi:FAD-dependent oxidoreductase [Paenibacillus urinalis]|uniref:FAD-dependent oxidoreductase n=1 Tax=Paenibacillus urinalis TaxID=521520 RepID=A0AAX3MV74_9BACL|nr:MULTISPECIES: FAD-dependent oxidoreductase [Paenibacillus]WDH80704.1 FAD-dependent oxidoreductase [Paenibacillus urinalis]WDH96757.1 FAD-dependent oxidoreductase [Paenibacillus urinalis]WDI00401.1 FAD-dependent oxidoreductase [Paenibacillus urinalis]GAK39070.1 oxidoreductase [Paenibacillus sp. TCA20]
MSFLKDMFSIFKKRELTLLESYKETNDVYTFVFEKDQDFIWRAGQYGLFSITHRAVKNGTKPFSIASTPSEKVVKITTRIGNTPSDYKQAMLELKQGMKMKVSGPVGAFYLDNSSPSLLVAGGIGITPIRSILTELETAKDVVERPIQVLYLDSHSSYLFKDELDEMAGRRPWIQVIYLDSREQLDQAISRFVNEYNNRGKYYAAGPKSLVESVSSHLQKNAITKQNIKKDAFFGY